MRRMNGPPDLSDARPTPLPPPAARSERDVRIDLAAADRPATLNGWDDTVYTHLSASVPSPGFRD